MITEKGSDNSLFDLHTKSQSQSQSRVLTDELVKVKLQVEYDRFIGNKSIASELCLIIAEINCLQDDAAVQVRQTKMSASMIKQIYSFIRFDHVNYVIDKYRQITYAIRYPKSYFRTALYNSVFELNSKIENDVNVDLRGV